MSKIPSVDNSATRGGATPVQPTQPARLPETPAIQQTIVQSINTGWNAPEQARVHYYTPAELDRIAGIKR